MTSPAAAPRAVFTRIRFSLLAAAVASATAFAAPVKNPRFVEPFDAAWRFFGEEAPGAQSPDFNDTAWTALDVPHDWSISGEFREDAPAGKAGAFLPTGIGWYRKTFELPGAARDRRVYVEFDGVMANSDVWINGHLLGHRPNGYVSFRYDLTPHLRPGPGAQNVLAVRADNHLQPASRWYAGAGIYRHVRLVAVSLVHVEPDSLFVFTPEIGETSATVRVKARALNRSADAAVVTPRIELLRADGSVAASLDAPELNLPAGAAGEIDATLTLPDPQRWDIGSPNLYRAQLDLVSAGKSLDRDSASLGVRECRFDAATGFWLNGRNLKIKGVCLHQDAGALGVAVPLSIWERRLHALRDLGVNAIRTSHNPMAPEFLDLCDRLGFLVLDEFFDCWTRAKNPYDYHLHFDEWAEIDARDTIRRDRNHPCVFAYSAGNEIHDTREPELAKRILGKLISLYHAEDPTRPVTQALFRPNATNDYENGLADLLDVVGQNYREDELLAAHRQNPSRRILGTENRHDAETWRALRDHPPFSGQFLWPGIAYLGESSGWPGVGFPIGLLDRTGAPYPRAFERRSWWSDTPTVFAVRRTGRDIARQTDPGYGPSTRFRQVLFPDWTPADLSSHEEQVEVYSNAPQVELFLNGKSLGSRRLNPGAAPRFWRVPFAPGVLEAVARDGGAEVARHTLRTAGAAARLVCSSGPQELARPQDGMVVVRIAVADTNGTVVPSAVLPVTFSVEGPARIVAVDNGDNASHEPFAATRRTTYRGRCVAFVRLTGPGAATVRAEAPGVEPFELRLE